MHIIFGKEQADELSNKYTVLELDTFQFGTDGPVVTAYCTVETIPLEELAMLSATQAQHEHLLINYRMRNWADCLVGIDQLLGKWRGELDSFYTDLRSRAQSYLVNSPKSEWSHIILKQNS